MDLTCVLCGNPDLTPSLSGWRCDSCGAYTLDGKQVPPALPDDREQAREEAERAAEDMSVDRDLNAERLYQHRVGGAL